MSHERSLDDIIVDVVEPIDLREVTQATRNAMRSYVQDASFIEAFANERGAFDPEAFGSIEAPLVANLRLVKPFATMNTSDLEEVARENAITLYTDALEREAIQTNAKRLAAENHEYRTRMLTDVLTGAWNRRALDQRATELFAQSQRDHTPLSVLMLDIDRFKSVNDTYGHQKGDEVLEWFANTVSGALRQSDYFARYGGEEFTILAYGGDESDVIGLANRVREQVAHTSPGLLDPDQPELGFTVSIGVSMYSPGADDRSDVSLIRDDHFKAADKRLYIAKQTGRNTVVYRDPTGPE